MDRMGGPTGKAESQAGAFPATSSGPAPYLPLGELNKKQGAAK